MIDESKLAFLDTETGGLDPVRNPIWEIAVIVDGKEYCWQQRITYAGAPPASDSWWRGVVLAGIVDQWVIDNTGIRDRYHHDKALTWRESAERVVKLTAGRHLVGMVPSFDAERLALMINHDIFDWRRSGAIASWAGGLLPWHHHLIDVETLAVGYLMGHHAGRSGFLPTAEADPHSGLVDVLPWNACDLSSAFGVDPDDFGPAHQALNDARWVRALYTAIVRGR